MPASSRTDDARRRIEPTLDRDSADALRLGPPGRHGSRRAQRLPERTGWWLAAVAGLVIIALLFGYRQPLSERLWPETRAQQLRADAALALAEGRLTAPDGSGARELYEAALALDPDRLETRAGLARVGQAALEEARHAIDAGRYRDARASLTVARQLRVPRQQADAIEAALRKRQAAQPGIDQWLVAAESARQAGDLDGKSDAALPLYQRVLALQPHRTEALEGREDALSELLQQAWSALRADELARASGILRQVRRYDAGHAELPDAMAELARLVERHDRAAQRALQRGQLITARALWRELLAVDADNADAQRGLADVGNAYTALARRDASDFRFDDAEAALREARATAADVPAAASAIAETERHIVRARQSRDRLRSTDVPTISDSEREQRVTRLLAEARAAEVRGDLLTPPGDSAFDKLHAARTLAPRDERVEAATDRLLPTSWRCYQDALRGNRLGRAGRCLQASEALGAQADELRAARQRLAQRWIAVGDERLGAGEIAAAEAALSAARALDPQVAGLAAFEGRLRAATIGD